LVGGKYHGAKKPTNVNDFLSRFREDIVKLRTHGLQFRGKKIDVVVSGLCCDAPSTTFVMNIATHNAYYGFRKCNTRGLLVGNIVTHHTRPKTSGRVTFSELDAPLRTDDSFRKRLQLKHQHKDCGRSIIKDILGDVISNFVLDYMHFVCIGIRKKDLNTWLIAEGLYGVKYEAYNKDGGRVVLSSGLQEPVFVRGRLG
jgi:hypothetical protein